MQGSWQTTLNCNTLIVLPIKKMPILLITGNQPAPATSASAVEGVLWINIASSTMDHSNGIYIVAQEDVRCIVDTNMSGVFEGSKSIVHQAHLENSMCRGDIHKDIKVIKHYVVLRNCLHFLLM
jgi:hypothetical protein